MASVLEAAVAAQKKGIPQDKWPEAWRNVYAAAQKKGLITPDVGFEKPASVDFRKPVDVDKPLGPQISLGFGEMQAFGKVETKGQALARGGIDAETGGPREARAAAGFARSDEEALEAVERILQAEFGEGARVSIEPSTGKIIYFNPQKEQWATMDPTGLDKGDLADLEGELRPIIGGIVGAIGGAALGSIGGPGGTVTGGVVGDFVGTAAGEYIRLLEGRERGVVPPGVTDLDIALDALFDGGITALSGVAFNMAIRSFLDAPGVRGKLDVDATELSKRIRERDAIHKEVGTKRTAGQVMRGTEEGDELLSLEADIMRGRDPAARMMRARTRSNMTAAERYYDDITGVGRGDVNAEMVGQEIKATMGQYHRDILNADTALTMRTKGKLVDAATGHGPRRVPTKDIGGNIRSAFRDAVDEFETLADERYLVVRTQADALDPIRPDNLVAFRARYKKLFNSDIFKSLQESNKKLVDDLDNLVETKTVTEFGPDRLPRKRTVTSIKNVNYQQLSRALSSLRRLERNIDLGLTPDVDRALVGNLTFEVRQARNQLLLQEPGLLRKVQEVDKWYAGEKELYDRSIIGRLLRTERGGTKEVINNEEAFDYLFKADAESQRSVFNVLNKPQHANTLLKLRGAINDAWKNAVQPNIGDVVDSAAHARFIRENRRAIDIFLPESQRRGMTNAAVYARQLAKFTKDQEGTERALAKTFEGKIIKLDSADDVFKESWKSTVKTRKTVSHIRSNEKLFQGYKELASEDMWRGMTNVGADSNRILNPAKIRTYVGKNSGQIDATFGKGSSKRMMTLAEALDDVTAEPLVRPGAKRVNPLYDMGRAYVGLFTTPGRFLTAYRKISSKAGHKRIAKLLLNPEFIAKYQANPNSRVVRQMIGAAGAYDLFLAPKLKPEEPEYAAPVNPGPVPVMDRPQLFRQF